MDLEAFDNLGLVEITKKLQTVQSVGFPRSLPIMTSSWSSMPRRSLTWSCLLRTGQSNPRPSASNWNLLERNARILKHITRSSIGSLKLKQRNLLPLISLV
ncbi:hypothetical protein HanRHA438_Chr06g0285071 [Helianthus annuus]|uniref:Uncharacterized protein n=1 Tax=Helianthus annuus TaxID=4232 RepID=A0A251UJR5_HELAN|nr:hypothetical protein HanXRQr2_Chr06g0276011 [Helianthus annuus]KAJ0568484.1 hypothetical protein HanIR_Chr06g0296711 [Helianthus annuus]KAJ0913392.1 hypothetical protein HanRHA438_Chr06g0285071 [Helianthus annuus]KAJ0916875.1 hypothetical protein HanPSC8_Chr06g0266851 [Helianthus annuus]